MSDFDEPTATEVDTYYLKVKKDAESSGYHLSPDTEFIKELLKKRDLDVSILQIYLLC